MTDPRIETLTAAFYDDPLTKFLLPQHAGRAKPLSIAMEFVLGLAPEKSIIATPEMECAGVIGAAPSGKYPLPSSRSYFVLSKLVLKSVFSGVPLDVIGQWIRIFSKFGAIHPRLPHWYVLVLGVHPKCQGKGLGGKLLTPILEKADAERVAVYLESANPRNLDFYRKHGFEVTSELVPIPGCPTIRGLFRERRL
jgi:ribosomal protein S18 acetylase RimI-like enzyme